MKICIVSSVGGHLTEVQLMREAYEQHDYFYVLNDALQLPDDMKENTYFIRHSERDWLFLVNLWEAYQICRKERPDLLLSTGAGAIVPFSIVGKLFFRTKVIFVESFTRVHAPSMTGRIMYRLADRFFYQWQGLGRFFPKGIYGGIIL